MIYNIKFFALGLLILLTHATIAQHCPYDGSTALLIQLDFENKSLLQHLQMDLIAPQLDSNVADCQDFTLTMDLKKQYVMSIQHTGFGDYLYQKFNKEYDLKPQFYVFFLSHNHRFCYKKDKIVHRGFALQLKLKGSKSNTYKLTIQPDQIYNLCTGAGSWQRIQAIHLKVKENGEFMRLKN
jgi:hypothetical protein